MSRPVLLLLLLSSVPQWSQQELIDDLLESLSKGVSFFQKQSGNINLDGVVGYVILQGTTSQLHWPGLLEFGTFMTSVWFITS